MMDLAGTYNLLFDKLADPRVSKWAMMANPFQLLALIGMYLYAIYYYLPRHMHNRKPYDLKNIIQVYNVAQVLACTYIIYTLGVEGWFTHYTFGCELVDYSNNPSAVRMVGIIWWTMLLKIMELVETCFFILRNKRNQVSVLHVYHHCTTLMFAWITVKYMGGGMATFAIILNCMVHLVMYAYYFLAALGPNVQKKLAPIKSKITMMQMIQFVLLVVHTSQTLLPSCKFPDLAAYVFVPNVIILLTFFANFYIQSYNKKSAKPTAKAEKSH